MPFPAAGIGARLLKKAFVLAVLVLGAACVRPKPKPAVQAPKPVTAEARREADRLHYEATQAYLDGDYGLAKDLLLDVFAADPSHPDGKALLARIRAAEKLGKR